MGRPVESVINDLPNLANAANNELKNTQSTTTLSTTQPIDFYGQSNEAVLASLLKQQGIGPASNNVPLNVNKSID